MNAEHLTQTILRLIGEAGGQCDEWLAERIIAAVAQTCVCGHTRKAHLRRGGELICFADDCRCRAFKPHGS